MIFKSTDNMIYFENIIIPWMDCSGAQNPFPVIYPEKKRKIYKYISVNSYILYKGKKFIKRCKNNNNSLKHQIHKKKSTVKYNNLSMD